MMDKVRKPITTLLRQICVYKTISSVAYTNNTLLSATKTCMAVCIALFTGDIDSEYRLFYSYTACTLAWYILD
jgi:hypothetical protein